jgi:hypothetical protein
MLVPGAHTSGLIVNPSHDDGPRLLVLEIVQGGAVDVFRFPTEKKFTFVVIRFLGEVMVWDPDPALPQDHTTAVPMASIASTAAQYPAAPLHSVLDTFGSWYELEITSGTS